MILLASPRHAALPAADRAKTPTKCPKPLADPVALCPSAAPLCPIPVVVPQDSLVAIVDPPRPGLHSEVLKALRSCLPLRRIVYVSCHAPSFVTNAVPLCRPTSTSFPGEPFMPTDAYAVDLFPHTPRCELVVLLERRKAAPAAVPKLAAPSSVASLHSEQGDSEESTSGAILDGRASGDPPTENCHE